MRMSIPYIVAALSALIWLANQCRTWQEVQNWLVRVCEILFAAAVFALMFSLARTTIG